MGDPSRIWGAQQSSGSPTTAQQSRVGGLGVSVRSGGALRDLRCPTELGVSLGWGGSHWGGVSLRLEAAPRPPGSSFPPQHLLLDQKTRQKSVSCSTTRSAAKPFWGHGPPQAPPRSPTASGVPGTPQPHPQGELLLLSGGHDWGVKGAPCCSRWAASILLPSPSFYPSILHPSPSLSTPSVRPTRVGAADSSAHAPPPPPTAGRCEGLHCRPGCASRQKRRRSAEVAEAQRAAATRSPPQPTAGTALTGGGPGGGTGCGILGGCWGDALRAPRGILRIHRLSPIILITVWARRTFRGCVLGGGVLALQSPLFSWLISRPLRSQRGAAGRCPPGGGYLKRCADTAAFRSPLQPRGSLNLAVSVSPPRCRAGLRGAPGSPLWIRGVKWGHTGGAERSGWCSAFGRAQRCARRELGQKWGETLLLGRGSRSTRLPSFPPHMDSLYSLPSPHRSPIFLLPLNPLPPVPFPCSPAVGQEGLLGTPVGRAGCPLHQLHVRMGFTH